MDETRLMRLDEQAVATVSSLDRHRFAFDDVANTPGRPFVAVVGPRGAGKTVLLRQLRAHCDYALYISADTLEDEDSLVDLVNRFRESYGVRRFFVDEIHFIREYPRQLKELYDFTDVAVWFTSSVALSLTATAWDLSRRVHTIYLRPFTFREYVAFSEGPDLQRLPLRSALSEPIPPNHLRTAGRFDTYLKGGLHPFMLEPGATPALFENILTKVITGDIPRYDPRISAEEIDRIQKVVRFIGRSAVDGINYSSVARNVGITKYKAAQYLDLLERSFLVRRVFPEGTNVLKEPKVVMQLPYRLLYRDYTDCVGALREDYFALAMEQHNQSFTYAKTTRGGKTPDYVMQLNDEQVVVEIGGQGKGRSQFKEVEYARKIVLYHGDPSRAAPGVRVPLLAVGFA